MQYQPASIDNTEVSSAQDTPEAVRLLASFMEDLEANRFVLTSLPDVALKVRSVLDNPSVAISDIADIISNDPAIAAKLIRVSNSPLYRSWEPCETVQAALLRLGVQTSRELVMSFALKDLFKVEIEPVREAMEKAWRHTLYHGAIAFVMAGKSGHFSTEEAMTAALMSNIGVLSICNYLENHPEIYQHPEGIDHAIELLKAPVGSLMLERWGLSEQLVDCARHADDWQRTHSGDPDLCDLVITAGLHAYISHRRVPALESVPAFRKLHEAGLLAPENALDFLESASDQVAGARSLLEL